MAETSTRKGDEIQYVTLCLGAEVFAVPVALVREILDYREAFRVPEGPAYLNGLIDVRGRATPVIDLRTKLGLTRAETTTATRIMVVDVPIDDPEAAPTAAHQTLALGLVADTVLEVISLSTDQIEPVPTVGNSWRLGYIAGIVRRDDGFVLIFDLQKLMTAPDIDALSLSCDSVSPV
ncbi:MAG: chemotaxis protein CheW [Rhizomicrobium sp.]